MFNDIPWRCSREMILNHHVRWDWTLVCSWQYTIKGWLHSLLHVQISLGLRSVVWSFSFTEASLQTHSTEWQILPGCREKSYWKFSSPLQAKTLLYPSRRLFSEDNSKLYDVKDKSSIESWQVFDMFCLSEGNDRSKKTHEFSSLLETQKNNFE